MNKQTIFVGVLLAVVLILAGCTIPDTGETIRLNIPNQIHLNETKTLEDGVAGRQVTITLLSFTSNTCTTQSDGTRVCTELLPSARIRVDLAGDPVQSREISISTGGEQAWLPFTNFEIKAVSIPDEVDGQKPDSIILLVQVPRPCTELGCRETIQLNAVTSIHSNQTKRLEENSQVSIKLSSFTFNTCTEPNEDGAAACTRLLPGATFVVTGPQDAPSEEITIMEGETKTVFGMYSIEVVEIPPKTPSYEPNHVNIIVRRVSNEATVWLHYQPLQCTDTPWNSWHESLGRTYVRAPTEEEILTEYYATVHQVEILDFEEVPLSEGTVVCAACGCPRDYSLRVQVAASDAEKLIAEEWSRNETEPNTDFEVEFRWYGGFSLREYTLITIRDHALTREIQCHDFDSGRSGCESQTISIALSETEWNGLKTFFQQSGILELEQSDLVESCENSGSCVTDLPNKNVKVRLGTESIELDWYYLEPNPAAIDAVTEKITELEQRFNQVLVVAENDSIDVNGTIELTVYNNSNETIFFYEHAVCVSSLSFLKETENGFEPQTVDTAPCELMLVLPRIESLEPGAQQSFTQQIPEAGTWKASFLYAESQAEERLGEPQHEVESNLFTVMANTACTLDARICPDGSAVGRIPPSCEFAPCPEN